jgi:hypothetical protein
MKNTVYKISHKPDGLKDLEELSNDLLSTKVNGNHPFSVQTLNNLIWKVDSIIKKLTHKPRLPLYQIENEIIEICKTDTATHGVIVQILFSTKFGEINTSRLSKLTVRI